MKNLKLGVDIGSTTVKLIILDDNNEIIVSHYTRHLSNVRETLITLVKDTIEKIGDVSLSTTFTGSGGLTLAKNINVNFLQEVVAVATAIEKVIPSTNVAIEIGGEDAKIIYFENGLDQRMNGICAGGTGSFIDQMASLLQTDAQGLNELALNHDTIYSIAARCGVFAKTDIQPLINEGARRENLAASIFQAVASQTISGLACGKPIRGKVAFLGGPLHFMPALRERFIDLLSLEEDEIIIPENSHLFAAMGAGLTSDTTIKTNLSTLLESLINNKTSSFEINRLEPLFNNSKEYDIFMTRHDKNKVEYEDLSTYSGDVFLGIDAGSTTTKLVLIGSDNQILHSHYSSNQGNPLKVIIEALQDIYSKMPPNTKIVNSCITGYGEALGQSALKIDIGEIETVAHYTAASFFEPEVDFILDIGGQDMKCITINDGVIDNVTLNEACSAGCGSFIETFAKSLDTQISEFANIALFAQNPIDLGSRCTVFMNSRVKQAQKEGASVADISAGLSYSVIKNALQKVIKITDPEKMGKKIVVQGGTFYNNSILRSFEIISGRNAIRPNISGLMGAFGASLIAKNKYENSYISTLISLEEINNFKVATLLTRCKSCNNNCLLTINKFNDNSKFITGNRCERGLGSDNKKNEIPNLYDYKYNRLFNYYTQLEDSQSIRGTVGIPRVLNIFENYPLWHTFFTTLKYKVVLSPESSRKLYEKGIESIPSESVCYPAKLVHGHIMELIKEKADFIFYPSIVYEIKENNKATNHYNCPVVISYPENIKNNVEEIETLDFKNPFLNLNDTPSMEKTLCDIFPQIDKNEIKIALKAGLEELENYKKDVRLEGERVLDYLKENNIKGVVLAGRPYHIDPEINHGIPELITGYGIGILSEDSICHLKENDRKLNAVDQWTYHARLYNAASLVTTKNNIELVQLNSFGCGIDAISVDEVHDILTSYNKLHTVLKIDEVNNLGSARIRIRSLLAALEQRDTKKLHLKVNKDITEIKRVVFTKEMRKTHTILAPQLSPIHFELLEPVFAAEGYNVVVMPSIDNKSIDTGLRYVNNDTCYPALIVVGQIINALQSGEYDLNNVSILITQTGGSCRATNYISLIRKALSNINMGHIPVISLSPSGLEKNPGFKLPLSLLRKAVMAGVFGDLFMNVVYRIRPYEEVEGSTNKLHRQWAEKCKELLYNDDKKLFSKYINDIVKDFDNLPLKDIVKPRVGIVGEILVKFHPTANNDVVTLLENEGAEVVSPDLLGFFIYSFYSPIYSAENFGGSKKTSFFMKIAINYIEKFRKPMIDALNKSKRFHAPLPIHKLIELAEPIVSIGNQSGEGWFLTAEMVELIHNKVNNIICMQPFACLPNHVTGKGVIKALRTRYPFSNIVAIDYDPGASEVNQLNRIKLMLTTAERRIQVSSTEKVLEDKKSIVDVGKKIITEKTSKKSYSIN